MQKQPKQSKQYLLLEDVYGLGRKGDLAHPKPGYARNFLVPNKLAVMADSRTLRLKQRLADERQRQAVVDLKESEEIKNQLNHKEFETIVAVDHEGHLYGSVGAKQVVEIVKEKTGIELDHRTVRLPQGMAIKKLGGHCIRLALKEGVECEIALTVRPDRSVEGFDAGSDITVE